MLVINKIRNNRVIVVLQETFFCSFSIETLLRHEYIACGDFLYRQKLVRVKQMFLFTISDFELIRLILSNVFLIVWLNSQHCVHRGLAS